MKPIQFPEANTIFRPPEGMSEEECADLPAHVVKDQPGLQAAIVSCWQPTAEELEQIARTGRVWLYVMGDAMPPVAISGKTPFEEKQT